jgi:hypothetical protein
MISFDTDILVYATVSVADAKALRARDLITRAMRGMMDHLIAASPCGVRERGDPQGGNTIEDIRRTIDASRAQIGREPH